LRASDQTFHFEWFSQEIPQPRGLLAEGTRRVLDSIAAWAGQCDP